MRSPARPAPESMFRERSVRQRLRTVPLQALSSFSLNLQWRRDFPLYYRRGTYRFGKSFHFRRVFHTWGDFHTRRYVDDVWGEKADCVANILGGQRAGNDELGVLAQPFKCAAESVPAERRSRASRMTAYSSVEQQCIGSVRYSSRVIRKR